MKRNYNNQILPIIVVLLLVISIAYAVLQTNLEINGTTKISSNTWNVHFTNVQISSGSVSIGDGDSAASIDANNNLKVNFSVTLSVPGDFYEFTVDVVNEGSIDAMIGSINKVLKVDNVIVEEIPDYLNYSVTYANGSEIEPNQLLASNTTKTIKVRLEFRSDIDELPDAATISTSVEPVYIQADDTAVVGNLYNVFKLEAESGSNLVQEYRGGHKDSFTESATHDIYYWYGGVGATIPVDGTPILPVDGIDPATGSSTATSTGSSIDSTVDAYIMNRWNVFFAGFCWQMWRTTDTGGVKLVYNGLPVNGKCELRGDSIGRSFFNENRTSLADIGYMYNPTTLYPTKSEYRYNNSYLYGSDISYSNGVYTLSDTSNSLSANYHYSCNNSTGTCETVRFYYDYANFYYYYIELSNGKLVDDALEDMLWADDVNQQNSTIKNFIDDWYQNNLLEYTSKLEDTIFCDDRTIYDIGGWDSDRDFSELEFYNYGDTLECKNITDQFSMNNPKATLTYPIGLLTIPEARLLSSYNLRKKKDLYMLLTPFKFFSYMAFVGAHSSSDVSADIQPWDTSQYEADVYPTVSLKPGTEYSSGDGSLEHPYVIE